MERSSSPGEIRTLVRRFPLLREIQSLPCLTATLGLFRPPGYPGYLSMFLPCLYLSFYFPELFRLSRGMLAITYIKLLISLSLLSYASIEDLKHREISDIVWFLFSVLALSINLVSLFVFRYFYIDAISIVYVLALLVIFLSLYYVGAYGGADAKALVCITLMFPFLDENTSLSSFTLLPIPVATFFYASLLSLIQIPLNLVHNLLLVFRKEKVFEGIREPFLKKILALLLLRKERVKKCYINLFFTPAEAIREDGSKKLIFFSNFTSNLAIKDDELIFVSPLIPFVFFLMFGFLFFVVFGDYVVVNIIKAVGPLAH